jgi:hypothetical protein
LLAKEILTTLKLGLHIMQAQRCGKMNLMISKVIFGHWDVCFMK